MARAMKCDICGQYFDYQPGKLEPNYIRIESKYYIDQHFPEHRNIKSFDTCPLCIKRISEFIDHLGNEIQM